MATTTKVNLSAEQRASLVGIAERVGCVRRGRGSVEELMRAIADGRVNVAFSLHNVGYGGIKQTIANPVLVPECPKRWDRVVADGAQSWGFTLT